MEFGGKKENDQEARIPEIEPEGYLGGYNKGWWGVAAPNRRLISRYNSMDPEKLWDKYLLLKELLGSVDEKAIIEAPFRCDNGKNIFLGKQFYANYGLVILDAAPVTFGDNVIVGPNAMFCAASHPIHPDCRFHNGDFPILSAPITVGDNVWIGGGVIVLPGVTIGSGSVIGAGSVVTRDIPPMSVAAGSPCRVLRKINENDRYEWPEDIV